MAPRRTPRNAANQQPKKVVIELSSDAESNVSDDAAPQESTAKPPLETQDLREKVEQTQGKKNEETSPTSAKLAVRVKDTGSVKHRHVNIEIPLPSSSMRRRKEEIPDSEDEGIFKTPLEKKKHVTFDDSDNDEFVTPMEFPLKNPLESSIIRSAKARAETERDLDAVEEEQEEEEDSDDDAPPEVVSSHAAESQLAKAAQAAVKAAEKQAANQKRKRQDRDAFFKQQAMEKKSAQKPASPKSDDEADAPARKQEPLFLEKRKREIPKLLPLEFLESDDEDEDAQNGSAADGKVKKRKVAAAGQNWIADIKPARDQRVGSTVFRVVEKRGDGNLAPKVKKQSVIMKQILLRRNRAPQAKRGFFVKQR
ncbi:hypothetical protein B0T25DRAFT_148539 [Lasiosphaeria hispida]|uniref:Uncharacterized protein n=1 Tax=Lasiosphaeria hispida TaxID=260671 RepID=A0AAJ0HM64_9PEZI|nr:hypothetical protein B0T25DRAFT_148539 [Lasiosphaeria hispida]